MFKSLNEPTKRKIVNYLFYPPFLAQPHRPFIISESGIGIEIFYYPTKIRSHAAEIHILNAGNNYVIPHINTDYYIPTVDIGRISFNYDVEPHYEPAPNGTVGHFYNSVPIIPTTHQLVYQDFDRLLVYITTHANDFAFLLRIIKERP